MTSSLSRQAKGSCNVSWFSFCGYWCLWKLCLGANILMCMYIYYHIPLSTDHTKKLYIPTWYDKNGSCYPPPPPSPHMEMWKREKRRKPDGNRWSLPKSPNFSLLDPSFLTYFVGRYVKIDTYIFRIFGNLFPLLVVLTWLCRRKWKKTQ